MNVRRRTVAALLAACALATPLAASAQSDTWPSKPIRIVSPFPPGGTTDMLGRLFAPGLSQALGQQVIVENRTGGNGAVGTGFVAKAPPDGYTWAVVFDTHGVNPSLIPNLPYDTRKDFAPVMLIATGAMLITTHASQPYKSFGELIEAAKAKPGAIGYGTIGSGSLAQLAMTQMQASGKFNVTHVPYRGGGPLTQDTIAGHVPVSMATVALLSPHVKSGAIRALAVSSANRDPALPDVPTVAEQGLPGFEANAWWALIAPAGTPPAVVSRMNAEVAKLLREPAIRDRLTAAGMNIVASQPDELARFVDGQITRWEKIVKEYGIKAGD